MEMDMAFKNILVALDIADLPNAENALKEALFQVEASGAMLHLLYVRHHFPQGDAKLLAANFDSEERDESHEILARFKAGLDLDADRSTITSASGSVTYAVLDQAEKWAADLIVIGSHTPSLTSKLFGSNASSIIREAKVSVLIVRAIEAVEA